MRVGRHAGAFALHPYEAEVAARGAERDVALVDQRDRGTLRRGAPGNRAANQAAADDDKVVGHPGRVALRRLWGQTAFLVLKERPMSDTVDALLHDMLDWLARDVRPYGEVMDAWRTSCPRLPVWEDANDRGFVEHTRLNGCAVVRVTPAGRAFLSQRG